MISPVLGFHLQHHINNKRLLEQAIYVKVMRITDSHFTPYAAVETPLETLQ